MGRSAGGTSISKVERAGLAWQPTERASLSSSEKGLDRMKGGGWTARSLEGEKGQLGSQGSE